MLVYGIFLEVFFNEKIKIINFWVILQTNYLTIFLKTTYIVLAFSK